MKDLFGDEVIRTLGLYQPYAGLMLPPYNKIETRWVKVGKKPPFPFGKYLIYSTQKAYKPYEFRSIAGEYGKAVENDITRLEMFHRTGHAIGIGDLVGIEPFTQNHQPYAFVAFSESQTHMRWCLIFDNMKAIKPFQFAGKQGIGFLSDVCKAKIELA